MATNNWQRVEELFHAASDIQRVERTSYLTRECGEDEQLRREVESLLEALEGEHGLLEHSAMGLGMRVLSSLKRKLRQGEFVGHYKILRPLGAGGMGEVYLAEDCTLERQVALKFLAEGFGDNQWAKDQLMKEARAVARLENSNICVVHGLEEIGAHNFIVMQYVEGETLASLLLREPLSPDLALDFAEQIVNALAAAHLRGIIHRDIKPQNIIVTPERQIKVLDFGLAKFVQQKLSSGITDLSKSETAQVGFAVGTAAYMSPEQTAGRELDDRSDIFSFGVMLYEMLSGHNPFRRSATEETLVAINDNQPPRLPRTVPEEINKICFQCLEKDRSQRFANTEELLLAIQRLRDRRRSRGLKAYLQAVRQHRNFRVYALAAVVLLACLISIASLLSVGP